MCVGERTRHCSKRITEAWHVIFLWIHHGDIENTGKKLYLFTVAEVYPPLAAPKATRAMAEQVPIDENKERWESNVPTFQYSLLWRPIWDKQK
jgi:hypothetical protein